MKQPKMPQMVDLFARIKKMSYRQFDSYISTLVRDSYENGFQDGESEIEGVMWKEDDIFNLLRSEHIGFEKANRIVDRLLEGVNEA